MAVEGHGFWLANTHDSFYNVAGVARGGTAPDARDGYGVNPGYGNFVGTEIDIVATYAVTRFAQVEAGYGHFFVGDYIQQSLSNPAFRVAGRELRLRPDQPRTFEPAAGRALCEHENHHARCARGHSLREREPFSKIMKAVAALRPEQSLRILAPFEPVPLFELLGRQGFQHAARANAAGDWEVLFTRRSACASPTEVLPTGAAGGRRGYAVAATGNNRTGCARA